MLLQQGYGRALILHCERSDPSLHSKSPAPKTCLKFVPTTVFQGSNQGDPNLSIISQGQIRAMWILAAKLPNSDLNFAVDFFGDFCSCFSNEKGPKNPPQKLKHRWSKKPEFKKSKILLGFLKTLGLQQLTSESQLLQLLGFGRFFFEPDSARKRQKSTKICSYCNYCDFFVSSPIRPENGKNRSKIAIHAIIGSKFRKKNCNNCKFLVDCCRFRAESGSKTNRSKPLQDLQ